MEPLLLTDHPTSRDGGEGAPVVGRRKLGRGIRTEQELQQIAVGVGIVQTTDIRQCTALRTGELCIFFRAVHHGIVLSGGKLVGLGLRGVGTLTFGLRLLDGEQSTDMMLAEVA